MFTYLATGHFVLVCMYFICILVFTRVVAFLGWTRIEIKGIAFNQGSTCISLTSPNRHAVMYMYSTLSAIAMY